MSSKEKVKPMQGTKAELFPSEFFVGDELAENWTERLTITGWAMRLMFDESKQKESEKPVLLFDGKKPMPLNVTNFESLEKLTGKHSAAAFVGYTVTFYRTLDRRNKRPCIRVDEKERADAPKTATRDTFLERAAELGMETQAAEIAKRHIAAKSTWGAALAELNTLAPAPEQDEQPEAELA